MKNIAVLTSTKEEFNNWIKENKEEEVKYYHIHNFRFGNTLFDDIIELENSNKMNWGIKNAVLRQLKK